MRPVRICFLSLPAYPTIAQLNLGYAGGAEIEQVALAKELVNHGYDVCLITYLTGDNPITKIEGIRIIQTYDRNQSSKLSSFQKYTCLLSALKKANSDIYFHESGAVGVLPLYCRLFQSKYVYRIPSDTTVQLGSIQGDLSFGPKLMNLMELKSANILLAQNNFQKRILKERFDIDSVLIRNGLFINPVCNKKPNPPVVLWVGSISSIKRPELFLKLAKSIPWAHFEMIGGRGFPNYLYDEIELASSKLPNLKFKGFVPHSKIYKSYQNASILVNTSKMEGFPNTFLEAWMYNTPVVSLNVDPDGLIKNENLGLFSGNYKQMISDIESLLTDESYRLSMGHNCRKYVEKEHNIKKILKKYLEIFSSLL